MFRVVRMFLHAPGLRHSLTGLPSTSSLLFCDGTCECQLILVMYIHFLLIFFHILYRKSRDKLPPECIRCFLFQDPPCADRQAHRGKYVHDCFVIIDNMLAVMLWQFWRETDGYWLIHSATVFILYLQTEPQGTNGTFHDNVFPVTQPRHWREVRALTPASFLAASCFVYTIYEVLQHTSRTSLSHLLSRRHLSVFGHVARFVDDIPANMVLQLHINVFHSTVITIIAVMVHVCYR